MFLLLLIVILAAAGGFLGQLLELAAWLIVALAVVGVVVALLAYLGFRRLRSRA
ncbi:MAG: hypothetical protein M3N68_14410 [Actinomycetota bacterium]|nr:hypothetical protein [Actinomycetota bacterium]